MAFKNGLKILLNNMLESHLLSSFIFGMLGAILVSIIVHYSEAKDKQIATVNVTYLVNQFIKEESQKNKSKESLKKEVKRYGAQLESSLKQLAKQKELILLPSEAVIAGARDYTEILRGMLNKERVNNDE